VLAVLPDVTLSETGLKVAVKPEGRAAEKLMVVAGLVVARLLCRLMLRVVCDVLPG
jgi:hypothetical protein